MVSLCWIGKNLRQINCANQWVMVHYNNKPVLVILIWTLARILSHLVIYKTINIITKMEQTISGSKLFYKLRIANIITVE